MSTNRDSAIQNAKDIFHKQQFADWKFDPSFRPRTGGQSAALGVIDHNGQTGVFLCSAKSDDDFTKRFLHQIAILTSSEFKHRNIVNILAHTSDRDALWYISERGQDFGEFWIQRARQVDPIERVHLAANFIQQLCSGLKTLHRNHVIHRDIKPGNLIIKQDRTDFYPVLIDFGVAYSTISEQRITRIDDAVGNGAFSPDQMMNRMDDPPPWLDVFQLSQLLIWMTSKGNTKKWSRPLDWRWVQYDDRVPPEIVLSLRAITALCSEERLSPRDAEELSHLLAEQFRKRRIIQDGDIDPIADEINAGIARGIASKSVVAVNQRRYVESSYPRAKQFYDKLRADVELIIQEMVTVHTPALPETQELANIKNKLEK